MKKLFALLGAILLWQTMAVAQNYLHITSGGETKMVRIAELDSVTLRAVDFYDPKYLCEGVFTTTFFGESFEAPVYMQCITERQHRYIVDGPLYYVIDLDPLTGKCNVPLNNVRYEHPTYGEMRAHGYGVYDSEKREFRLEVEYTVDAGTFGSFVEILQLGDPADAMPSRVQERRELKAPNLKVVKTMPMKKANADILPEDAQPTLLKEVSPRVITEKK